ncbi:MAG TPA: hypothetical protein VGX94_13605 [Terriglobia bacterium]|nr:hypothetical protein [Terriglobia bacterium]
MRKFVLSVMVLSLLALLGGASLFAEPAAQAPAATSQPAKHSHHAKKAGTENLTAKYAAGVQSLSGTLSIVDAQQKSVVVTDSNGTPFNITVGKGTKIEVSGKKGTLDDLSGQTNQQVSVKYRDRLDKGLSAVSIEVGG